MNLAVAFVRTAMNWIRKHHCVRTSMSVTMERTPVTKQSARALTHSAAMIVLAMLDTPSTSL